MKIRSFFVSNSSSSSFTIKLCDITAEQYLKIIDLEDHNEDFIEYPWTLEVLEDSICGDTDMDNFDMETFLIEILKIPEDKINWG